MVDNGRQPPFPAGEYRFSLLNTESGFNRQVQVSFFNGFEHVAKRPDLPSPVQEISLGAIRQIDHRHVKARPQPLGHFAAIEAAFDDQVDKS